MLMKTVTLSRTVLAAIVTDKLDNENQIAWPTGTAILAWRALVRRGLATETTGSCEGCKSHRPGQQVPVFVMPADVWAHVRPNRKG